MSEFPLVDELERACFAVAELDPNGAQRLIAAHAAITSHHAALAARCAELERLIVDSRRKHGLCRERDALHGLRCECPDGRNRPRRAGRRFR